VGAVVSPFDTVTVIALVVVTLPAASVATAASVWLPLVALVVFHDTEAGEYGYGHPRFDPSSLNWTVNTPLLSLAVAVTSIVPEAVLPGTGAVNDTVGGVVSATFETVTEMAPDVVTLPAASRATAVNEWLPLAAIVVFQETEYGDVVSSAPRVAPSSLNCTPTTPTLSLAFAVTATADPRPSRPRLGAVIETMGGVVSGTTFETVTVMALTS